MNTRLLIAIVILAVLAALSLTQMRAREPVASVATPTATLPALERDEISKIELSNPQKQLTATLVKQGDKWQLSAPVDAPADAPAVEALLDKLTDLQGVSIAATRKENHERVGVDAAHAIRVKAYGADKLLLDAYVGDSKSSGTMLRKEGEEQVLAVRGSIRYAFDKELRYLRDRTITELDPAALASVSLSSAKGSFKFENHEGNWQQAKGEKPIKDFASSKVQSLVSSFAKLRATNFAAPDVSAESTGFERPTAKLTLTPKEGSDTVLELGNVVEGSDYYVRKSGEPTVYRISKYTGERLIADAAAFSEPPKKPGESAAPSPPPAGNPMAGGQGIPPEIMKQLQQQMGQASPH